MGGKTLAPQKGACQFHGAKSFSDYGQTGEERRLFFLIIHALQSRQWAEPVSPKKLEFWGHFGMPGRYSIIGQYYKSLALMRKRGLETVST